MRKTNITIEKADVIDAAEILEYLKQVGGETDNLTFGREGVPFTASEEIEFLKSFENSKDKIMLLAKENGKIIGNASLSRLSGRMSHRGNFGVSVLKKNWNMGVGSKLLAQIIDFARENKFELIELEVRSDNKNAIHLYEKFGFKKIATYPEFYKLKGEYIDFDFMLLKL